MSYPHPPGQPPQGPPPGYPPYGAPPPAGPPYPGASYGGPPPRRNVGLIVAIVAFVVLLVAGIATTAILLLAGDDDDGDGDRKAGKDRSTSSSPSPSESATPTDPTTDASGSATGPITPYAPTDDVGDDIHGDVKAADFPGDWDFKLGDVEHKATYRASWDYDSCGPVEEGSVFTQQRCEYSVQWTYSALGGKARLTHIFLVFDTERHAKAAEATIKDADFDLRKESVVDKFVQGKWNKSVYGNIIGVTIATTNATVEEKELQSLVNYMNTDYRLALLWKGF